MNTIKNLNNNCPLCGSVKKSTKWKIKDVTYVKCNDCTLIYQDPQPSYEYLKDLYSEKYYVNETEPTDSVGYQNYTDEYTKLIALDFYKLLEKYKHTNSKYILDIGCATGNFLEIAKYKGWDVTGIEISEWSSNIGKSKGLNIYPKLLHECNFESNYFDVITMFDVIEHFQNPVKEIIEIHRILKPNGILIIETPNIESFTTKFIYGKGSDLVKPNAHLVLLSSKTIKLLLVKHGFKIINIKKIPLTRKYRHFLNNYMRRLLKKILCKIDYKIGPINLKAYTKKPECVDLPKLTINDILQVIASKE
ncbi:MAG: class I SAM-dependent methyltransferase [Bacteroidetes bacterium]|nr:class I SAM-dependent methyltransferase [Bacteroidota bacterium]